MKIKAKFPLPKQHEVVVPPIDWISDLDGGFNPAKVKEELCDIEQNVDKTKLSDKIPAAKKFQLAKVEPEKFFPGNEDSEDEDWVEVSSFTNGVNDWFTAKKKKGKYSWWKNAKKNGKFPLALKKENMKIYSVKIRCPNLAGRVQWLVKT